MKKLGIEGEVKSTIDNYRDAERKASEEKFKKKADDRTTVPVAALVKMIKKSSTND